MNTKRPLGNPTSHGFQDAFISYSKFMDRGFDHAGQRVEITSLLAKESQSFESCAM